MAGEYGEDDESKPSMTHRYAQGAAETEVDTGFRTKSGRYLLTDPMAPVYRRHDLSYRLWYGT
ncbi:hypothetical protein CGU41_22530 [Pseudomonas aeruginosa]|nr:hypothetical protein CGU41_22530 [Pseudomonas aeruginosa]